MIGETETSTIATWHSNYSLNILTKSLTLCTETKMTVWGKHSPTVILRKGINMIFVFLEHHKHD